jgi:hypothetical protein
VATQPDQTVQPSGAEFSIYFANDGGPLLVLPVELMPYWEGGDEPADGHTIQTPIDDELGQFAGTDYARACAAGGMLAVILIGDGTGIVIGAGDEANGVQWLRLSSQPGILLTIPMWGEESADALLIEELQRSPDDDWNLVFPSFLTASGGLVLMHAANSGQNVHMVTEEPYATVLDGIPCQIEPGTYAVEEREIVLPTQPGESRFVVCRFRPAAG